MQLDGGSAKDRWRYIRTRLQVGLSGVSVAYLMVLDSYLRLPSLRQGELLRRPRMVLQSGGREEPPLYVLLLWSRSAHGSIALPRSVRHGLGDGVSFVRHDLHI